MHRFSEPFTREQMVLPIVQFDSFDVPIESTIRPIFDALWNAARDGPTKDYTDSGDLID
jgi:hypothetical protein